MLTGAGFMSLSVLYHRSIVGKPDVFNPSDKKSPKHLDCQGFTSILKQHQLELCRQYDNLLSTTAIGTLQALSQCQEVFKDRAWNCSVFSDSSTHYLGRFVENCMYLCQLWTCMYAYRLLV